METHEYQIHRNGCYAKDVVEYDQKRDVRTVTWTITMVPGCTGECAK